GNTRRRCPAGGPGRGLGARPRVRRPLARERRRCRRGAERPAARDPRPLRAAPGAAGRAPRGAAAPRRRLPARPHARHRAAIRPLPGRGSHGVRIRDLKGALYMRPRLDLIALVVEDMARSLAFYRHLDVELPPDADQQRHVETTFEGGTRLAWDTEANV